MIYSKVDCKKNVQGLFLHNIHYPYYSIPWSSQEMETLRSWQFHTVTHDIDEGKAIGVHIGDAFWTVRPLTHVNAFMKNVTCYGITNTVLPSACRPRAAQDIAYRMVMLTREVLSNIDGNPIALLANISAINMDFIVGMESAGMQCVGGFTNMVSRTSHQCNFRYDIGFATADDMDSIRAAYMASDFPSWIRLLYNMNGDWERNWHLLYAKNMVSSWEQDPQSVLSAYINNQWAGSIIVKVNKDLQQYGGIVAHPMSGMGIIINPLMQHQGVATELIRYRQNLYHQMGMPWVSLGANLSNVPMIRCLEKMGFMGGSVELTLLLQ